MKILTSLDRWDITLVNGAHMAVRADGYSEASGDYVFLLYVERDPDEPGLTNAAIVCASPAVPNRLSLVIARVPVKVVSGILSS